MRKKDLLVCLDCEWAFDGECRFNAPIVLRTYADKENFGLWSGFPTHPKTGVCRSFKKQEYEPYKTDFQKAKISKAKKKGKINEK